MIKYIKTSHYAQEESNKDEFPVRMPSLDHQRLHCQKAKATVPNFPCRANCTGTNWLGDKRHRESKSSLLRSLHPPLFGLSS